MGKNERRQVKHLARCLGPDKRWQVELMINNYLLEIKLRQLQSLQHRVRAQGFGPQDP